MPPLQSLISPNSFLHIPRPSPTSPSSPNKNKHKYLIFFIPGNPGLLSYYHTFLSLLSGSESGCGCVIAGFSLRGFEISSTSTSGDGGELEKMLLRGGTKGEKVPRGPLFSLREQIEVTAGRVGRLVGMLKGEEEEEGREKWKVILIGHSVGAYIALEVLRLHRQKFHQTGDVEHWNAGWYWTGGDGDGFDITACILLTPTIFDIAISDNGRAVTPLLRYIPGLPLVVSLAVRGVTMLLPEAWLEMLVKIVMGRGATDEAVGTTVSFLKSGNGVRECLGMAKDEMSEIKEDRWGEEVWGVVQGGVDGDDERKDGFENAKVGKLKEPAELVFYFARKDHWIADQTRDVIIRMRGGRQENAGPKMIVAEDEELVHGWCIRQNGLVARKVAEWVEEIVMRR